MTDFRLTTQRADADLAVAHVSGDLDFDTAPHVRSQSLALIEQGHRHLLLDLEAVTFCDSSGLNALIGIYRCAKEAGGSVTLAAVPDRLERLLNLTGLTTQLPAYPTTAHALNAHTSSRNTAIA
ncbi:STAS domain-containing protein [Streptomyces sp. NPDC058655]|uniref:STAS domain-containing protein n=1 Tax=unclassified Streptomyces TaxID=2593676 RepID=UPI003657565B